MRKQYNTYKTQITNVPTAEGESIEETLRRLTANKQPIPEDVPKIYTPSEDGVTGDYDIRHDRFDAAIEARDKFNKSQIAKGAGLGETDQGEKKEDEQKKQEQNAE